MGRKQKKHIIPKHRSLGVNIVSQRLNLLTHKQFKNNIIYTNLSKNGKPTGTRVKIVLPIL